MILRLRFALLFLVACSAWASSPPEIVPGLPYFRITDLTTDAADISAALNKDSFVLDLRNTAGSPESAAALSQRLEKSHPDGHGVWLILVNPTTSAEIVKVVSRPRPRQLTIGPRTPALAPDIAVSTSVEEDRRAYEAFGSGTPLDKLISNNLEKKRFDEAALARTRASAAAASDRDPEDLDIPDGAEIAAVDHATPDKKTPPLPVVPHDLVLERATQIYRALVVAKR